MFSSQVGKINFPVTRVSKDLEITEGGGGGLGGNKLYSFKSVEALIDNSVFPWEKVSGLQGLS